MQKVVDESAFYAATEPRKPDGQIFSFGEAFTIHPADALNITCPVITYCQQN